MSNSFSHLVVIGSSAGGIEALSRLLVTLPEDFPAPIVIAQHLDPERESNLNEILSHRSTLPVRTVTDHEPLEAGVVFVVPANCHVNITDSEIDLHIDSAGRPKPSVDLLMSSAAEVYGENLIAVVLTGTGSDGTEGARVVSRAGGTVIIQDPETAEFGGMPGSLAPNTIDIVARLERIGPVLKDLLSGVEISEEEPREDERRSLKRFLEELRERHGVDFTSYKTPTILRRLKRRMVAVGVESIEEYRRYLEDHPEEYQQLINAFLVKVTEFFRDPELFEYLREQVLPGLIEEARERENNQLRIWSAGCATGEEAYSLAILLSEALGSEAGLFNVRIFATDLDEEAINFARRGIYPASALEGLSEEQVKRYFVEEDGQYEVKRQVRSMVVFGEHDLARRSPFPNIDLVASRNVLIYFTLELQRRALQLFAYSLRDGGYLVLGKVETISPLAEFFAPQDRRHKVYRRQGERFLMPPTTQVSPAPPKLRTHNEVVAADLQAPSEPSREPRRVRGSDEGFLNRLPVGVVVVNRRYDIQAINTTARRLLSIRGAAIGEDLLHTMREVPYAEVRDAIDSAFRDESSAGTGEFTIEEADTGEPRHLRLICSPERPKDGRGMTETVTIVIEDITQEANARRDLEERLEEARAELERSRREAQAEATRQEAQNRRLVETKRQLEEANRELTTINEDLQTAYEDSLLTTEEAQAATEEVETLNEELQATNEELETLNEELQATVEELNATNEDLSARSAELHELVRTREKERREAEADRQQLETILRSISDMVLAVDAEGKALFTNDLFEETFSKAIARGDDPSEILVALDEAGEKLPPEATPWSRAAREKSFVMRFIVEEDDRTRRRFEARGRPIAEEGGGVIVLREVG